MIKLKVSLLLSELSDRRVTDTLLRKLQEVGLGIRITIGVKTIHTYVHA